MFTRMVTIASVTTVTERQGGQKAGFATLSFGAERDFQVKHAASGVVTTVLHRDGHVLHLPFPMNSECLHGVPKRKRVTECRISLTFREIV